MKKAYKKRFTFSLSEETKISLVQLSNKYGMSMSKIIDILVKTAIEKSNKEDKEETQDKSIIKVG